MLLTEVYYIVSSGNIYSVRLEHLKELDFDEITISQFSDALQPATKCLNTI